MLKYFEMIKVYQIKQIPIKMKTELIFLMKDYYQENPMYNKFDDSY